jgi:hypothetical protein
MSWSAHKGKYAPWLTRYANGKKNKAVTNLHAAGKVGCALTALLSVSAPLLAGTTGGTSEATRDYYSGKNGLEKPYLLA